MAWNPSLSDAVGGLSAPAAAVLTSASVDELARHRVDRDAPQRAAPDEQDAEAHDVRPTPQAEARVAHQLDAVVQRVELREHLRPLGKAVDREERPGDEEEWSEDRAHDVAEVLERGGEAGDGDPETRPAEPRDPRDRWDEQHPPR